MIIDFTMRLRIDREQLSRQISLLGRLQKSEQSEDLEGILNLLLEISLKAWYAESENG